MSEAPGRKFCPKCGSPRRADAAFCPKCGSWIMLATGALGPSSTSTTPTPAPRRSISRRALTIIALVVAILVIVPSVYWYEYRPGGPQNPYIVHVSEVIWTQNGAAMSTSPGFMRHAGTNIQLSVELSCYSYFGYPSTCQTGSVYIQNPDFGIVNTNTPTSWSSGSSSANFSVLVLVSVPPHAYSGTLQIDLH